MYWINDGRYCVSEIEDSFAVKLDIVNVKDFNDGKGRDYAYWDNIIHPQTGEKLIATRGYLDKNSNKCFYAEYQGQDGKFYNYTAGMRGESIRSYQLQDDAARIEAIKHADARQKFLDIMNGKKNETASTESVSQDNQHNNDRL